MSELIPFKFKYHHKIACGLSDTELSAYPDWLDSKYSKYEFLNCYVTFTNSKKETTIKTGRFLGVETIPNSNENIIRLYTTGENNTDLIHNISFPLQYDTRVKYCQEMRCVIESPYSTTIAVDMYDYYTYYLLLLYARKVKIHEKINSDCFYYISTFLKPLQLKGYDIIWNK